MPMLSLDRCRWRKTESIHGEPMGPFQGWRVLHQALGCLLESGTSRTLLQKFSNII